jgi:hypothetical protein
LPAETDLVHGTCRDTSGVCKNEASRYRTQEDTFSGDRRSRPRRAGTYLQRGRRCLRRPGCRQVHRRMRRRKRGTGGFRAESCVTAVTQTAALRADGRSCKPASPTRPAAWPDEPLWWPAGGSRVPQEGSRDPRPSREPRGLLLQGSLRKRLPADGPAMDDLSRSREQPENSRWLLADGTSRECCSQ